MTGAGEISDVAEAENPLSAADDRRPPVVDSLQKPQAGSPVIGTVDVRGAQDDHGQPVLVELPQEKVLGQHLRFHVGLHPAGRPAPVLLRNAGRAVAEHESRGNVDEALQGDASLPQLPEEVSGRVVGIAAGLFHRRGIPDERGGMDHVVYSAGQIDRSRLGKVAIHEGDGKPREEMKVRSPADHAVDVVGVIEEISAEVGADESVRAGDQDALHPTSLRSGTSGPCLFRVCFEYATFFSTGCSPSSISKYTLAVKGFRYACSAAASFGLESVVRSEIEGLGIGGTRVEDRRVLFDATARDIVRCNVWLRSADRVLIQVGDFPAPDFDSLYQGIRALPWRDLLAPFPAVTVEARSARSRLTAVPSLQSVAKKAIVDAVRGPAALMPETGPRYDVQLSLQKDRATVSLDTTGRGLHKRGYRRHTGDAPLRENLAAALVLLSRWDSSRAFADPVCGSGTIAIEAALLAANIAPGIGRSFAAEEWPLFPASVWSEVRASARDARVRPVNVRIDASDRDPAMVRAAMANAAAAGVADLIRFYTAPLESFSAAGEFGCLVCNPPYGERLGNMREAQELARAIGSLRSRLVTWSFFVLSALEDFPRCFGGPASRNRKLYNGNIRCWYYQYFGPLPRG